MFPTTLFYFLIQILIVCLIAGLALWVLAQFAPPEPIGKVIRVIIIVVVCLWLIYALVGILPGGARLSQ